MRTAVVMIYNTCTANALIGDYRDCMLKIKCNGLINS